ncbi:MAG: ferrochelatase [Cyanobacteria bacterium P01_D01_bin.73]
MGRVGVLLLNLGGPDKLEDVRPFLFNLFADPEIIRLPAPWMQKPLAWLISSLRARKSQESYKVIGGGSPLRRITEEQAAELEKSLTNRGYDAKVYIGMRYWYPFTEEAVEEIKKDGVDQLVILPLYPHFSISTSGSSFRLLEKIWDNDEELHEIKHSVVPSWYHHPDYLGAMADLIGKKIDQADDPENAHVFFSAHGVPASYVTEAGDPYQKEIEDCTSMIMEKLGRSNPHSLAYQSRVGPVEWLQPYTDVAIEELGEAKVEELVVVPISFVSEHIETLEEIDVEYRELAEESGIRNFLRVPALDSHPQFIEALTDMTVKEIENPGIPLSAVMHPPASTKIYPQEKWEWGLTTAAEVWNGRLAMIGFLGLCVELFSGQGPLHFIGIL